MRIVLATSSFNGGGITSYALEFIKNFCVNNELHVILGDDSYTPIITPGVIVHKLDCSDLSLRNASKIVELINNKIVPDVLVSSNALIISLIAKYLNDKIRIITISHSLKYYEADISARAHKYIDCIIALSRYNKIYLDTRFNIKNINKVQVVYNFVKDKDLSSQIFIKKKSRDIILINPGGAHPSKSPEIIIPVIIQLCKTNLDFKFIWMGNTNIQNSNRCLLSKYHSVSQILPKDNRIILTGKISRDEAEKIIERANILIFPSCREGCSMALLESMRAGTIPIVADFDNANKELIQDGTNGYVIKHSDIDAFTCRIIDIIQHNNIYSQIYDNVRYSFEQQLNEELWKTKMDSILYEKSILHERCRLKFRKLNYIYDRFVLRLGIIISKIHMFCEEDLRVIKELNKY